ncbi:MAG: nitroreductase family deazaflavin-dependent oxidoreductase [Myxococcota bacterium]
MPQKGKQPPRKTTEADLRKARPIMKIMSRVNTWIFRLTGGAVGSRFPGSGAPVGLLVYTGRKTRQSRTMPLVYGLDGDRVILIASQGGMPRHPIWYHSLVENPDVTFQIGRDVKAYTARELSGDARLEAWRFPAAVHSDFDVYQQRTDRVIPVIALEPRAS